MNKINFREKKPLRLSDLQVGNLFNYCGLLCVVLDIENRLIRIGSFESGTTWKEDNDFKVTRCRITDYSATEIEETRDGLASEVAVGDSFTSRVSGIEYTVLPQDDASTYFLPCSGGKHMITGIALDSRVLIKTEPKDVRYDDMESGQAYRVGASVCVNFGKKLYHLGFKDALSVLGVDDGFTKYPVNLEIICEEK